MGNGGRENSDYDGLQDEQLLIDFVLGRCNEATAGRVRRRLETDGDFALLHEGVSRTFSTLGFCGAPDPPADLPGRTLERVRSARRTEALLNARSGGGGSLLPRFSIRELAALAAAAVVVVGILIPSLRQAHRLADRSLCAANVGVIGTAMSHYANRSDGNLPASPAVTEVWLRRPGQKHTSNSAGLFLLVRGTYAAPDVFQCPATGGRSFAVTADMVDFPSPRSINYSYQYSLNASIRRDLPKLTSTARRMAVLADATPVFAGGAFRSERLKRTVSENHRDGGQNVLYLDGHVDWTTDCRVGIGGDNIWLAQGIYDYTGEEKPASPTDTFLLPHPGW